MEFITSWVQGIIVAVIIATIIEMILPEGNSKKYIKIVLGVYIIFNIISPVISKVTGKELDFSSIINIDKYEEEISSYEVNTKDLEDSNNSNIKEVYILNLKKDMKSKIEEKGYMVNSIYIELEDNEEYKVKSVKLTIHKIETEIQNERNDEKSINIETVNIQIEVNSNTVTNSEETNNIKTLTKSEIQEIKQYINSTYEIAKEKISINE